jgi:hypothetical protein
MFLILLSPLCVNSGISLCISLLICQFPILSLTPKTHDGEKWKIENVKWKMENLFCFLRSINAAVQRGA